MTVAATPDGEARVRVVDVDTRIAEAEGQVAAMEEGASVRLVPGLYPVALADCRPAADNLRRDVGDVSELAQSIREDGLLEPLVLTTDGTIVCGHRRHAAAQLAGLSEVAAIVREMTAAQRAAAMLAENVQRCNLTAIEEARGFQLVLDGMGSASGRKPGKRVKTVAQRIGVTDERVRDRLALLRLPEDLQERVHRGEMNIGDAVMLSRLVEYPKRLEKALKHPLGIAHAVKRELDDLAREEKRAVRRRELVESGVTVVDLTYLYDRPEGYVSVGPMAWRTDDVRMDPEEHASCPHRAVGLDKWGSTTELCAQPGSHVQPVEDGDAQDDGVEPTAVTAPAQGSVRTQLRAAMAERRDSRLTVAQIMLSCVDPSHGADVALFGLQTVLAMSESPLWSDPQTVFQLCGLEVPDDADIDAPDELVRAYVLTPEHGHRLAAAIAVTEVEEMCSRVYGHDNPFDDVTVRTYYDLLGAHGYVPCDAEVTLRAEADDRIGDDVDDTGCEEQQAAEPTDA